MAQMSTLRVVFGSPIVWIIGALAGAGILWRGAKDSGVLDNLLPGVDPRDVTVTYSGSAKTLAPWIEALLKQAAARAGVTKLVVTSTVRTPEDQARIMLGNIKEYGLTHSLKMYSIAGDQIATLISVMYEQQQTMKSTTGRTVPSDSAIITAAAKEIRTLHNAGKIVSRHVANSTFAAVDIGPVSSELGDAAGLTAEGNKLVAALEDLPEVRKVIPPPTDPAIHVEFDLAGGKSVLAGLSGSFSAPRASLGRAGWAAPNTKLGCGCTGLGCDCTSACNH